MNRFDKYTPITFNIPQYIPDFKEFDELLDQQNDYFQKAKDEKLRMEEAADKVASSIKYFDHPLANEKDKYNSWVKDQQTRQDEISDTYRSKGVEAGQIALEKYKKDLIKDVQNGIAFDLNKNYEKGASTLKEIQEVYKEDPQVVNYYAFGEGAKEWIGNKEGKLDLKTPNYLPYIKDEDRQKIWSEAVKNLSFDKNSVIGYLKDGTPARVIQHLQLLDDPYNYLMETGNREWLDVNKLNKALMSTLSPRLLQSLELSGRVNLGNKGLGDLNNLLKYYAIDSKTGSLLEENGEAVSINLDDQEKYDKYAGNPNVTLVQSFNPQNPFGRQLKNLSESHSFNRINSNFEKVSTGLEHIENLKFKMLQEDNDNHWKEVDAKRAANKDANDEKWNKLKYDLDVEKQALEIEKLKVEKEKLALASPAVIPMETSSNTYNQMPSFGTVNDKGEFEVTTTSMEKRKKNLAKRASDIGVILLNPNSGLSADKTKALYEEQDAITKEMKEINFINTEFDRYNQERKLISQKQINLLAEHPDLSKEYTLTLSKGGITTVKPMEYEGGASAYEIKDNFLYKNLQKEKRANIYVPIGRFKTTEEAEAFRKATNIPKAVKEAQDNYNRAKDDFLKQYPTSSTVVGDNHPFNNAKADKELQRTTAATLNQNSGSLEIKWTGNQNEISKLDDIKQKMIKKAPKGYTLAEVRLKPNQEFYFSTTPVRHGNIDVGTTQAVYEFVYKSSGSSDIVEDIVGLIPTRKLDGTANYTNSYFDEKYQQPDKQAQAILERTKGQPMALLYEDTNTSIFKRNNKFYIRDIDKNTELEYTENKVLKTLEYKLKEDARK